jgi:hypothetical protein
MDLKTVCEDVNVHYTQLNQTMSSMADFRKHSNEAYCYTEDEEFHG